MEAKRKGEQNMACTTILVGKKASYDGSTMIARNEDAMFVPKRMTVVTPEKQPKIYKTKISHLSIELPEKPMRYTANPNVDLKEGVWYANGINEANVGMSATETITTNPRVMGADPYVIYQPKKGKNKEVPGGIGEEDFVAIVLPYVKTAREGVLRLGNLLEQYGTYEPNGIAFNDENEVWWLETIGGHNWMAKRVRDEEYVIMPNQLGIDDFDLEDAYGAKKEHLCSKGLKKLIEGHHLNLNQGKKFNPRYALGSHSDSDHIYNTPRAWFIGRYFNPTTYKWDGEDAHFTPESDNIPWSLVPEKKITVEDIKYVLSSYYQGTPYNPYLKADYPQKGYYRPIGISRTGVMGICQIRGYMPKALRGIHWVSFGPNPFNVCVPVYAATDRIPDYLSKVTTDVSTDNLYWSSRILAALADSNYGYCIQLIERYQAAVANASHRLLNEYDEKMKKAKKYDLTKEADQKICDMAQKETVKALNNVLGEVSRHMRCGFSRADN